MGGITGIGGNCCVPGGLTGGGAQETTVAPGIAGGAAADIPDPCRGGGTQEFAPAVEAVLAALRGVVCLLVPTTRGVGAIPGPVGSPLKDLERDISRGGTERVGKDCAEYA